MSPDAWTINMQFNNKIKTSPVPRRRGVVNGAASDGFSAFLPEPPKDKSVFTDIKSILFILKATGLLPIYEEVSYYEVAPPTKLNEFYSFFIRGVTHSLTIFNLYNLFKPGSSQIFFSYSDTENVNKWIEILLCILAYTATVLICSRKAKSFLKIINEILKVDKEVWQQYGATLSNNCGFSVKFIIGIIVCQWYLVLLTVFFVDEPMTPITYFFTIFYGVQNGMSTIFIVFAAALLRIVKMRFEYLNLILRGYTYQQQRKLRRYMLVRRVGGVSVSNMETFPDDSLFAYRMHNKLLRIYKSINECCSLILVGYMGYAFYSITSTTYNLFVQITTQRSISISVLQWCYAWLMLHTSVLALLSKTCGQTTNEANLTSQVLARIYGKSKDHQNIVDKFLTKSIKQEVQFTAYGFFVIDTSTLFKIFSAVTTYLVILIQFKQLEDSKMEEHDEKAAQTEQLIK